MWRTARKHYESLVLLLAGGGEALSDIDVLRGGPGLSKWIGFKPSSATQFKDFLYRYYQDEQGKRQGSKGDGDWRSRGRRGSDRRDRGLWWLGTS